VNHGCSIVTKPARAQGEQEMERSNPRLRMKTNMGAEGMVIRTRSLSRCVGGRHETTDLCRNSGSPSGFRFELVLGAGRPTYKRIASAKSKVMPSGDVGGGHSSDDGEDITTSSERRAPALRNAFLERREA
jgi:hypothetical protein